MSKSLIDTGPLIALFDNSDQYHDRVISFMKDYRGKLTTTWPVITETCYMLDFSRETQLDFLDWIVAGGLEIYNIHQWQVGRVREWFATYSDLPADMADCTLMEVAETEKIHSIITLDRDFSIYKLGNGHYLENLLAG